MTAHTLTANGVVATVGESRVFATVRGLTQRVALLAEGFDSPVQSRIVEAGPGQVKTGVFVPNNPQGYVCLVAIGADGRVDRSAASTAGSATILTGTDIPGGIS